MRERRGEGNNSKGLTVIVINRALIFPCRERGGGGEEGEKQHQLILKDI